MKFHKDLISSFFSNPDNRQTKTDTDKSITSLDEVNILRASLSASEKIALFALAVHTAHKDKKHCMTVFFSVRAVRTGAKSALVRTARAHGP